MRLEWLERGETVHEVDIPKIGMAAIKVVGGMILAPSIVTLGFVPTTGGRAASPVVTATSRGRVPSATISNERHDCSFLVFSAVARVLNR